MKTLSLYSGAGGIDLGFKKNKFDTELSEEGVRILNLLIDHLPNNDAMVLASKILNIKKNILYKELIKGD